jgi:hypothetical protein
VLHSINARLLGESPWGWRDGVVTAIDGLWIHIEYPPEGSVRVWHHHDLSAELADGEPVRVHEQYFAMAIPGAWLAVYCTQGRGSVPKPVEPALWRSKATPVVVDLGTGRGFPVR